MTINNISSTNSSNTTTPSSSAVSDDTLNLPALQAALASVQATMSTDNEETFEMPGLSWNINVKEPVQNETSTSGVLYPKEHRPGVGTKLEIDIIKGMTDNCYDPYTFLNTSINDPESLKTNLSIQARLSKTEAVWRAYDMLNPCHILFPDPTRGNVVPLKWTEGPKKGQVKTMYLFEHYRRLSVIEVANSCEYYAKYVSFTMADNSKGTFARELAWTYSHFAKHVEPNLFEIVNSEFIRFKPTQQGGPLFLKLLLDKLAINNDASLEALVSTTINYNIKEMNEHEDIIEVTKLLSSVSNTIIALRNDKEYPLPEKYVQKMLKVLQTTSVAAFNSSFQMLEEQLTFNRRLKNSLNSPTLMGMGIQKLMITTPTSNWTLDNSPESLHILWTFAQSTYTELQTNGEWESAMRPSPATDPTHISHANTAMSVTCWNCGGPHTFPECTEEIDKERVDKNRQEFLSKKRRLYKRKQRKPPHAWRPPEPNENNKRVIYGKPYTWNESKNGWDRDHTPDSGLEETAHHAATESVAEPNNVATGDHDSHSMLTQNTIPPHEFSQMQLDLANLVQAFNRYG